MSDPETSPQRRLRVMREWRALLTRRNEIDPASSTGGLFDRYRDPVLTAAHTPVTWRYDLNLADNPHFLERLGVNSVFNAGAIEHDGKVAVMCRVEGVDRKSFFAVAESDNGIDGFRFRDEPVLLPETEAPDVNVYDMRLVRHQDGWIYGLFCTERKDPSAPAGDTSSAIAQCGIARTRDLDRWERLPDLKSRSPQQRNVVLHPEFVDGQYAFYTRPQDGFIEAGSGGGIGWALSRSIEHAEIGAEQIVDDKRYHTIKETKNGQGPAPLKTPEGWLHIAHGVRNTAAGLRYVLYAFLSELAHPERVTHRPGGYLLAPVGDERVGDVSNVVFCNGVVARAGGQVLLYYGSSDTRLHVATTTLDKLLDYVVHSPPDAERTAASVQQRRALIDKNRALLAGAGGAELLAALGSDRR